MSSLEMIGGCNFGLLLHIGMSFCGEWNVLFGWIPFSVDTAYCLPGQDDFGDESSFGVGMECYLSGINIKCM